MHARPFRDGCCSAGEVASFSTFAFLFGEFSSALIVDCRFLWPFVVTAVTVLGEMPPSSDGPSSFSITCCKRTAEHRLNTVSERLDALKELEER